MTDYLKKLNELEMSYHLEHHDDKAENTLFRRSTTKRNTSACLKATAMRTDTLVDAP